MFVWFCLYQKTQGERHQTMTTRPQQLIIRHPFWHPTQTISKSEQNTHVCLGFKTNHVRSRETAKIPQAAVAMGFGINLGAGCWRLQAGDVLRSANPWLRFIPGVGWHRPCSNVCLGAKGAKGSEKRRISNPLFPSENNVTYSWHIQKSAWWSLSFQNL